VKQAIRSALADADIDAAVSLYLGESVPDAIGFIDELERATKHIEANPATGSPRYAESLNIPRLRFWPLRRFPYALFYIEHTDHLDVIRCVHVSRDIPASLQESQQK